jgi:hypothetical protein
MGGPLPPRDVNIAKGPVPYCLEQISQDSDARTLLGTLRSDIAALAPAYRGLAAVFEADLLSLVYPHPAPIRAHLERYWFDATTPYFPGEPVNEIYAKGVLEALDHSLNSTSNDLPPLAIEAWWHLDHPNVEMLTTLSSDRLSLHIKTPRPAGAPGAGPTILGRYSVAWITAAGARGVDTTKVLGDSKAPKRR